MKRFVSIILLLGFLISCKSISDVAMKPIKNKKVGNLVGKIQFTTNRTYWGLKTDTYTNDILVIVMNKKTKFKYTAVSQNGGYYYFYNLPVGDYAVDSWKYVISITRGSSENDPGMIQFIVNSIKDLDFTIEDKVIKTVKDIMVNIEIPKDFDKNNFFTRLEDENIDDLKERFAKKDVKGYWNEFTWVKQQLSSKEEQVTQTDESIIQRYKSTSDSDYYSMEQLYKKGDYYLSFMLFHRIILNLLDASYVKRADRNIPITEDLLEVAKKANINLTADQSILLNDLNTFNNRIQQGDTDENFKSLFIKDYIDKYLKKVDDLRKYLKSIN